MIILPTIKNYENNDDENDNDNNTNNDDDNDNVNDNNNYDNNINNKGPSIFFNQKFTKGPVGIYYCRWRHLTAVITLMRSLQQTNFVNMKQVV